MISVLDTTAFSAAMRHEPEINSFLRDRPPGEFAVVPPVIAEIEYGVQRLDPDSGRARLLTAQKERLLCVLRLLDWIPAASAQFGAIKAGLEWAGTPIDDFDIAVAAIARAHGAEVITANLTHFTRIEASPAATGCDWPIRPPPFQVIACWREAGWQRIMGRPSQRTEGSTL